LAKGLNLNLSKKGAGVSYSPLKGLRVGLGSRGLRFTFTMPGTGVSYVKEFSIPFFKKKLAKRAKDAEAKKALEAQETEAATAGNIDEAAIEEAKRILAAAGQLPAQEPVAPVAPIAAAPVVPAAPVAAPVIVEPVVAAPAPVVEATPEFTGATYAEKEQEFFGVD